MKIENGSVVPETEEEKSALAALIDKEKTAVSAKNSELLEEMKKLKPLKDIDPNEYKTLKEQAAKAEEDRAKKAGEFDKLKEQMATAHAKELEARDAKIATLQKSLEENVLIATATQAIAAEKGSPLLLMPHVKSRTKLDESGNPVVVDDSGATRVDGQGKPVTIAALIAEMKADVATFGRAFDSSGASGGGTPPNGGGRSGTNFDHIKDPAQRLIALREAGIKE